jgi:hypothetical protein
MTSFDDREQAFENKFSHDGDMEFKIASRAARLFGLWAAGQMGLKGDEAEAYATNSVDIETARTGRDLLLTQVEKDLNARKLSFSRHRLEREMNDCYSAARRQLAGA